MAIRTPPSWLQAGSHPAENDRLYTKGIIKTQGVGSTNDCQVTSTGGMSLSVSTGYVYIAGTVTTTQGMYQSYNDSAVNLTVATSHPTLARIDRVCITVNDSAYGSLSDNIIIQIQTGTASGSPVAPTLPANSISLATIAVAAAAVSLNSGNITDTRTTAKLGLIDLQVIAAKVGAYTFADGDQEDLIECNGTFTLTIPTDATFNFNIGTQINILNINTGVITVAGAGGVTLNGTPGLKLRAQWSSATLVKRAPSTWVILGDLVA